MDMLASLAREKDEAMQATKDSGLSPRAFGVYWTLRNDDALRNARGRIVDTVLSILLGGDDDAKA